MRIHILSSKGGEGVVEYSTISRGFNGRWGDYYYPVKKSLKVSLVCVSMYAVHSKEWYTNSQVNLSKSIDVDSRWERMIERTNVHHQLISLYPAGWYGFVCPSIYGLTIPTNAQQTKPHKIHQHWYHQIEAEVWKQSHPPNINYHHCQQHRVPSSHHQT